MNATASWLLNGAKSVASDAASDIGNYASGVYSRATSPSLGTNSWGNVTNPISNPTPIKSQPKNNSTSPNNSTLDFLSNLFSGGGSINTSNPYLGGTPSAPSIGNGPSQGQINGEAGSTYNSLMGMLQPSINNSKASINAGIGADVAQQGANTNIANTTTANIQGMTKNQIAQLQNMYGQYTQNAEQGMLAGQAGTESLMREQQGSNIGAVTAAQGRSGFGSGIGQGDPFTQAEISAQNQPYYQQLTNLNAQTQSQVGQMAANMAQSLGGNMTTLDANATTQIAGIANNLMSQNTSLTQSIASLNQSMAQIYQAYASGAMSQATALTKLKEQMDQQYKNMQVIAYQAQLTYKAQEQANYNSSVQNQIEEQLVPSTQLTATSGFLNTLGQNTHLQHQLGGGYQLISNITGKPIAEFSVPTQAKDSYFSNGNNGG